MDRTFRTFMRSLLMEESAAYGFTITFWGSGLLLIAEFGLLHTVGVLEYATGSITGFGVLAVATFGGAFDTIEVDTRPSYHILGVVHYVAALVPIGITHLVIESALGKGVTLFLTGVLVSVGYNAFTILQEQLSEELADIES